MPNKAVTITVAIVLSATYIVDSEEDVEVDLSQNDANNQETVYQVSVSVNKELYERIRSDEAMCQALRELMKDDFDRTEQETKVLDITNLMKNLQLTIDQAMDALSIPSDQRPMYAGMVNEK